MAKKSSFGSLSAQEREDLRARIRELVETIGTHAEAAAVAELDVRQIGRLIAGESAPSLLAASRLAAAAGKSLDWVVGRGAPPGGPIDAALLAQLVAGVARTYREEKVALSDDELGRIAAEEYDIIVSTVDSPHDRATSARVALERLRRAVREAATSRVRRKRRGV